MVAQRVYGLCLGWSDVSAHGALRADLAMQTDVGRDRALASAPTLSRLETAATPEQAWALHGVLMEQFIASRRGPDRRAPRELVLDVDATHVPLHGAQQRGFFHGYYDNYCYLPLYVFCGQDLLACVLRPSDRDPASVVTALLKRLIDALRQTWPKLRIVVRGDSGFCRPRVLRGLERWGVDYVLGLQKNTRLLQRKRPVIPCLSPRGPASELCASLQELDVARVLRSEDLVPCPHVGTHQLICSRVEFTAVEEYLPVAQMQEGVSYRLRARHRVLERFSG